MVRRAIAAVALLGGLVFAAPAGAAGFTDPLPIPQVLDSDEITIHAAKTLVPILPGAPTEMWTFNGTFPGPTIRRQAGETTKINFVNDLPSDTGALTIHHHGEHATSADDGQPDDELIQPGQTRPYTYDLMENGAPERGAFQWYHDHRLDMTARNVWNGLAGMFIVEDPAEAALDLPEDEFDVPLMVVDRNFGMGNVLTYPLLDDPPFDTFDGETILVNGAAQPYMSVGDRRYRLRLLNASNSRVMKFSLTDGRTMTQIGTESGLLPAPIPRAEVELGPAERAEVIVDFAGALDDSVMLRADGTDILRFEVDQDLTDDSSLPSALRPLPDLGKSTRSRSFKLSTVEQDGEGKWGIGGKTFDRTRIDAEPKLGTTETWTFEGGNGTHVVHIHGTDFQVLSRNGAAPPVWEQGLKETVIVAPKETVVVKLRFTDHVGKYLFHCHVLEHEDHGMMAQYEVTPDGDAPTTDPEPIVTPTPTPTPTPTATATATAKPGLALRWASTPKRIRRGAAAKLRLEIRSTGTAATAAGTLAVKLTGGLTSGKKQRRKLSVPVAALTPGATKTVTIAIRAPRRLRAARVSATFGTHGATVAFRRSGRRSAATASAARAGLLCRL